MQVKKTLVFNFRFETPKLSKTPRIELVLNRIFVLKTKKEIKKFSFCDDDAMSRGEFASSVKSRLKSHVNHANDAVRKLQSSVGKADFLDAVDKTTTCLFHITDVIRNDLTESHNAKVTSLFADMIMKVMKVVRDSENVKKIGRETVAGVIKRFLEITDGLLSDLGYTDKVPKWASDGALDLHSPPLPQLALESSVEVSDTEKAGLVKLLILKGDLHRYQKYFMKTDLKSAERAYVMAHALQPTNGFVLNQLGVVAAANDLASVFYFCRAFSVQTPFEAALDTIKALVGPATETVVTRGKFQHWTALFFSEKALRDGRGVEGQTIQSDNEIFFSPFPGDEGACRPHWQRAMEEKMAIGEVKDEILRTLVFHVVNLVINRLSHQHLRQCVDYLLCAMEHVLESGDVDALEVLRIVQVLIFATSYQVYKRRQPIEPYVSYCLASMIALCVTHYLENNLTELTPLLVVIAAQWPKIRLLTQVSDGNSAPRQDDHFNNTLLESRLQRQVEKLRTDPSEESKAEEKGVLTSFVFPEEITVLLGHPDFAQSSGGLLPSHPGDIFDHSDLRNRVLAAWIKDLPGEGFYNLNKKAATICDFERFVLARDPTSPEPIVAVYPEFLVVDTNTVIDSIDELITLSKKLKIAISVVVYVELKFIAEKKQQRKSAEVRNAAAKGVDFIQRGIAVDSVRIFNYFGERKFDLELTSRDYSGFTHGPEGLVKNESNDDAILETCANLDRIAAPCSSSFVSPRISVKRVVVLTSDKILRMKAKAKRLVAVNFSDFMIWFQKIDDVKELSPDAEDDNGSFFS